MQAAPITFAEVPFQYREGLLWIEVTVPRLEKPLNFILDTGAGVSVINLTTAKRLGLKPGREVTVEGVQTRLTGYWPERMSARIGRVTLPREYLVVDLGKLSHSCERPMDGLVGLDFFRGRVVQIDFEAQVVRLITMEKRIVSGDLLPLQLHPSGMRVPVRVDGNELQWMRLDTGCASALQWVTSEIRPELCGGKAAIGLAEVCIPQTNTTVNLGTSAFRGVPTGLHREAIFAGEAGLLGNGLLSRFKTVTLDTKTGRMLLGSLRESK